MFRKKSSTIIILTIVILAIAYLIWAISNSFTIKGLLDDKDYFDAYKQNANTKFLLDIGNYDSNKTLQFFDVMANHYKTDQFNEWILPDLTGWSCAEIAYALDNVGQSYEIEYMDDADFDYNSILRTEPEVGTEINSDTVVKLYVNSFNGNNKNIAIASSLINMVEAGRYCIVSDLEKVYLCNADLSNKKLIYENNATDNHNCIKYVMVRKNLVYIYSYSNELGRLIEYDLDSESYSEIELKYNMIVPYILGNEIFFISDADTIRYKKYALNIDTKEIIEIDKYNSYISFGKGKILKIKKTNDKWVLIQEDTETNNDNLLVENESLFYFTTTIANKIYTLTYNYNEGYTECDLIEIGEDSQNIIDSFGDNVPFFPIMLKWKHDVIVLSNIIDDKMINIYNTKDEERSNIRIPNSIILEFNSPWYYCIGNYVYSYDPYEKGLGYRYNLITGEFEEYDLH